MSKNIYIYIYQYRFFPPLPPLLASWLVGFLAFSGFSAFRLLGFLASWLFGFSASWLLGFLASRLLGFSASCWFMLLCIPSSSPGFLAFAPSIGFLDLASRILSTSSSLFESSLRRTSWGASPPPTHPRLCRLFAE